MFASQLLKEMRKTLDPETMFGGDSGDVYGGLFDMFLGQQMADSGGLGLAKMLTEASLFTFCPRRVPYSYPIHCLPENGAGLGSKVSGRRRCFPLDCFSRKGSTPRKRIC